MHFFVFLFHYLFVGGEIMAECVQLSDTSLVVSQVDLVAHQQLWYVFTEVCHLRQPLDKRKSRISV